VTGTESWPALPYDAWRDTRHTLHMYLQVIGKVRLALAPMEPQWAQVPLYVTARGLNTSPVPHPNGVFDIDVDFVDHVVSVRAVEGRVERIRLEPRTVADFYAELMSALARLGREVEISTRPSEVANAILFPDDVEHASYDPEAANRFWRALVSADSVLKEHRARFRDRASLVHFFWGTFDLAYSRFSGRLLEAPTDAGVIARYAQDAEQWGAGFWPGDEKTREPAFFAYTFPKPDAIEEASVQPQAAHWRTDLGEFILPYEAVRTEEDPRGAVLDFLESTYRAGADRAGWPPQL
jgi:hypothetical protein